MSSVKVTKEYIKFKDNSKMSGIFPEIGMVMLWPGYENNIPDGYLICNGDILDKEETVSVNSNEKLYDKLFEKIGYKYGNVSNNANKFKLPDMRERFPLGVSAASFSNMNSSNIMSGVKKLTNQHFRHTHKLDTSKLYTGTNSNAAENTNQSNYVKYGIQQPLSGVSIATESGDNEDYLSKFNVMLFVIRYKND